MAAKVKWDRGAWWVVTHHDGNAAEKRVGPYQGRQARGRGDREEDQRGVGARDIRARRKPPKRFHSTDTRSTGSRGRSLPIERDAGARCHPQPRSSTSGTSGATWFRSSAARISARSESRTSRPSTTAASRPVGRGASARSRWSWRRCGGSSLVPRLTRRSTAIPSRSGRRAEGAGDARPSSGWIRRTCSRSRSSRLFSQRSGRVPGLYPLILFLADTGARLGEASALRWIDVDLERGTARIARSFSGGSYLSETKTGRERMRRALDSSPRGARTPAPDLFGR